MGLRRWQKGQLKTLLRDLLSVKLVRFERGKFRVGLEEPDRDKVRKRITGFIERRGSFLFLSQFDRPGERVRILAPEEGLRDGLLAVAELKDGGCKVLSSFESLQSVRLIKEFVRLKYCLPRSFGKGVQQEVRNLPSELNLEGRVDLRHLRHVTIDGERAKDFDDAVAIERRRNGFRLYVSIADVSHYVAPKTFIDREAFKRGMSIYFPDSVIPMLPKVLSDDLCSLKEREDRLCFSVVLDFDRNGKLEGFDFKRSVIRSVKRLTYEQVERAIVEKDKSERRRLKGLLTDLECMKEMAEILIEKRKERGSLDFDLPEPEILLDMEGRIRNISRSERLFSHRLIEEFMIAANRKVAEFLSERKVKTLFRVHEKPEKDKLHTFEKFLKGLSVRPVRHLQGVKRLQAILEEVKGRPYEFIVNRMLLRSMKQAHYEPTDRGHFGLGLSSYLHFTSPIRRYPDLICHRVLAAVLSDRPVPYSEEELAYMSTYLSERERTIMDVEREIEDRIRILFMKKRVGEEYEGMITHIAPFGFFVELFDVFVEGLVPFSDLLDDYYVLAEDGLSAKGRRRKKGFKIGDTVRVRIVSADPERRILRFSLVRSEKKGGP